MKLVVFGATRGIGLHVVTTAVQAGHDVRAFARDPAPLAGMKVDVALGDVLKPDTVAAAVAGRDAVVSALGQGTSNKPTTHMSEGTAAILAAMQAHGVKRGLFVTSSSSIRIHSRARHPTGFRSTTTGAGAAFRSSENEIRRVLPTYRPGALPESRPDRFPRPESHAPNL